MSRPFLRTDQQLHLPFRIDRDAESAPTPGRNSLTKRRRAGMEAIGG